MTSTAGSLRQRRTDWAYRARGKHAWLEELTIGAPLQIPGRRPVSRTPRTRFVPNAADEVSDTDGRAQNARTVCTIGTQPVIPAVYGVKAPL